VVRVVVQMGQERFNTKVGAAFASGDAEVIGELGKEVEPTRVGRVAEHAVA
jgi:hypothetical protein